MTNNELMHYGIPGMKWEKRKAQPVSETRRKMDSAKAGYKAAKKDYNKSFNKAYSYSGRHFISQYTNKSRRAESDKRWGDTYDKAKNLDSAKSAYKQSKAERDSKIQSEYAKMKKNASAGEKFVYNSATRKKAAKYVVDNNMSVAEATKKAKGDAWRNTALFLAAYGVGAGVVYSKIR